jgi:hypothetical protein
MDLTQSNHVIIVVTDVIVATWLLSLFLPSLRNISNIMGLFQLLGHALHSSHLMRHVSQVVGHSSLGVEHSSQVVGHSFLLVVLFSLLH